MCSISDIPIVGAAVNHISEATVGAASRGIRYVLYYQDNVDKLNSEINGLNIKEQEIEREVDRAKNNGKTIKEHVFKWQADVKTIKGQVSEFLEKHQGRTSWRCFNVLRCPNPYRRFQLGRWAAKMTPMVCEFSDLEKKQLGGEISYFPPKEYSPISSSEYRDFRSREGAYKKILEALSHKEDGFPVVGIYGFGGVGKTRMMEEASKEVKAKGIFNTVARANVGQVVDIGKIQDELAPYLGITDKNIGDRASQLKKRLSKGDTILVILDDVWSEIPFAEIGIPFGDSNIKGCKILLTSRLQDVCIRHNCKDPVEIDALAEEEAWDMFTKTVGNSTIESVRESLARKVCHKCARLPLIIAAVGKALHNKPQDSWNDALNQLTNCEPEKIQGIPPDAYACLRLSFNILHEDAYLCLLLCSLFGEDADIRIESLFRFATESGLLKGWKTLEEARSRVSAMVDVLKSSSLLLEGRTFYIAVKLHDIIRDVARSMTAKDPEYAFLSESCHSLWPKVNDLSSRKLIYLDFKSDTVDFPDDLVCPELHTLYLSCSNLSGELPDNFFEAFPKLECLSLDIKSLSAMPSSIPKLNRLRCLTIRSGGEIDISSIIQLKNLEMLRLQDFSLRGLPLDLRQLRRLRLLDLIGCTNIEIMRNVLSGLLYLEELYIPMDCNILDEETKKKAPLSSVLSKLTLLTSLEIYFEDVKFCPEENFCKNLRRYSISVGGDEKHQKHYDAIKSVRLCDDSIEGGVKTLVERGDEVILESVTGLQKCFSQGGGGAFTDLKWLIIRKCMDAEYPFRIHQRVGSFSKLSTLEIVGSGFKYLFCTSTARCLQQLEVLRIYDCKMMEEIVRNEGQLEEVNEIIDFPKLRFLSLSLLPALKSFCGKKKNIPSIATTEAASTPVHTLFDGTGTFTALRGCGSQVTKGFVTFPALRELLVDRLDDIRIIFSERGVFPVLETLNIRNLDNVREIWEKQCRREKSVCPNLSRLSVRNCGSLRNVLAPSVARDLVHLEDLEIESCEMMKEIIGTIGEEISNNFVFPALKFLRLEKLPMLNSFLCYGGESNIDQSQFFFCHKVVFPVLESLVIKYLDNVREIWEEQSHPEESFCKLEFLNVEGCHKLKNLIAYVMRQRLQNLKRLELSKCDSLISETAKPLVLLPKLEKLSLIGLPKLMETGLNSSDIILYPNLKILYIYGCNNLRNVFPPSVASHYAKLLEKLVIGGCEMMNEIITSAGKDDKEICLNNIEFPMLKTLGLVPLPIMNSFWGHGIIESNLEQQQSSRARKVLFPSLEKIAYAGPPINLEEVINLGGVSTFRLIHLNVCSTDSQAPQFIPPNWLLASRDLEFLTLKNCWFHESALFSLLGNSNPNYNGTAISFRRLRCVKVDSCRLSTIFPLSVAKTLQKLKILKVRSCGSIEEIVTDDERRNDHLVVGTCQEILFPKLRYAKLQDLPNLKSFCTSANCSFKMPSFEDVTIRNCPQMLSFTPRQISTPQVRVTVTYPSLHGEQEYSVEDYTTDVNNYLCQIMKTQGLNPSTAELVEKEEVVKSNCEDKGKSVVIG